MSKKKKPKVYIVGGLGNQFFCLGFAKYLSVIRDVTVIIDNKFLKYGSNFNRVSSILDFPKKDQNLEYRFRKSHLRIFLNFFVVRKIYWKLSRWIENISSENDLKLDNKLLTGSYKFRDYFAKWDYAELIGVDYFIDLIESVKLSETAQKLFKDIIEVNPVVMHLRLSDYLNFPKVYRITPEIYYLRAYQLFKKSKDTKIWLFCEEKKDIQTYYPKLYALANKIITNESELSDSESFYLLSKAKNFIITNSSFSQWAGWIAANTGSKVVSFCESQNSSSVANYYKWYIYLNSTSQIINPSSIPKEYIIQKEFIESLSIKIRNE